MDINTFTNEALIELYDNYTPQYDNLYKVEIFSNSSRTSIKGINLSNYISFHTTKVSFNGESLSLDRDSVTKNFKLKNSDSFSRTNTLSLTWRECDTWKVKRYHDNWIGMIYDRQKDCYNSFGLSPGNNAKNLLYRKIKISFPSNSSIGEDNYIEFSEVLPNTSGGIELGFNTVSNIISHTLSYYVTDWRFSWDIENEDTSEDTFEPSRAPRLAREEERFESDFQGVVKDKRLSEDKANKLMKEEAKFQEDAEKVTKGILNKNNLKKLSKEESRFQEDVIKKRISEDNYNKLSKEESRFQEDVIKKRVSEDSYNKLSKEESRFQEDSKVTNKSKGTPVPFEYSPTRSKLTQKTTPVEDSNKFVVVSNKNKNSVNYEENFNSAINTLKSTERVSSEEKTSTTKTRRDFKTNAEYQRYQLVRASEAGKEAGKALATKIIAEMKESENKTLNPFSSNKVQSNYSEFKVNSSFPRNLNGKRDLTYQNKEKTVSPSTPSNPLKFNNSPYKYSPTRETVSRYTKYKESK